MSILCSMVGATFGVAAVAEILRSKKGIAAVGNAQIDTAQSKFGGSSALFDGTGDYLTVDNLASGITGDFTFECWVRFSAFPSSGSFHMLATGDGNRYFALKNDGGTQKWESSVLTGANQYVARYTPTISTGVWYHIALVKSGSTLTLYQDGTSLTATTVAGSMTSTSTLFTSSTNILGAYTSANYSLNGWLDEMRISDSARYTANFTAPTEAFVNDANTVLLIHADGTDATTFFEDDNGVRFASRLRGINSAALSTAQSRFGGSSLIGSNTTNQQVEIDPRAITVLTGPFTIECFFRTTNLTQVNKILIFTSESQAGRRGLHITNQTFRYSISGNDVITTGNFLTSGTWHHIALVRDSGNTTNLYVDGVSRGSYANDTLGFSSSGSSRIFGLAGFFTPEGHIDEFRISKVARYTSAFTPPTEQFVNDADTTLLVHFDGTDGSTVFRDDNGAVPVTYTSDVVAFDGTDDFYSVSGLTTTAADSKFLTMAFTWFHNSGGNSRNQHFMTCRLGTTSGENGWEVCLQSGRFRYSSLDNSGADTDLVYGDFNGPTQNAWNQIVAYIDHNNFANCKYFLNGVDRTSSLLNGASVGAVNLANNNINWGSSNVSIRIGEQDSTAGYNSGFSDFLGRISQIYVHNASGAPSISNYWDHSTGRPKDLGTKGTATGLAQPLIYHYGGTSTFPTNNGTGFNSYTLTANGGVTTNAANTIYARAKRQKGITAVGNAQIDTAQSKFGGSSALFDGTGDWLKGGFHPEYNFQGDFTIEFWARLNSNGGSYVNTITHAWGITGGLSGWYITTNAYNGTQKFGFSFVTNAGTKTELNYGSTLPLSTWMHLAVCRDGNKLYFYKDGVLLNSGGYTLTEGIRGFVNNYDFGIGASPYDQTGAYDGHLDEIRISNSARYPGGTTFTPSTTPFQNDSNTLLLLHMDGTDGSTVFFDDNGIAPYTP